MKTQKSSKVVWVRTLLLAFISVMAAENCDGQGVVYVTPSLSIHYGPFPFSDNIDITGSGNTDFVLAGGGGGESYLYPQGENSVVEAGNGLIAALNSGAVVGPNPASTDPTWHWWNAVIDQTDYAQLADEAFFPGGPSDPGDPGEMYVWDNFQGSTAFLGFVLVYNGQNYYGWMEVENPLPMAYGFIVAWAYATTPNTPMVAGAGPLIPLAPVQIVRPGNLRLEWQSQVGQPYQVQFKDNLDAVSWSNLDLTIIATSTSTPADVPIVGTARFYRVIQVP